MYLSCLQWHSQKNLPRRANVPTVTRGRGRRRECDGGQHFSDSRQSLGVSWSPSSGVFWDPDRKWFWYIPVGFRDWECSLDQFSQNVTIIGKPTPFQNLVGLFAQFRKIAYRGPGSNWPISPHWFCQCVCVCSLRLFQNFESFRVLVCGGDGSVSWVLNEIDRLRLQKQVYWHRFFVLEILLHAGPFRSLLVKIDRSWKKII